MLEADKSTWQHVLDFNMLFGMFLESTDIDKLERTASTAVQARTSLGRAVLRHVLVQLTLLCDKVKNKPCMMYS